MQQGRCWVKSRMSEKAWIRAYRSDAATEQLGRCCYCGEPLNGTNISADHVVPRSRGGTTRKDNIKAACKPCNKTKGSMSEPAFLAAIKTLDADLPFSFILAYSRRKIWVATHRSCDRILRLAR